MAATEQDLVSTVSGHGVSGFSRSLAVWHGLPWAAEQPLEVKRWCATRTMEEHPEELISASPVR